MDLEPLGGLKLQIRAGRLGIVPMLSASWFAFLVPQVLANVLTSDAGHEVTGCPEYKVTAGALRAA